MYERLPHQHVFYLVAIAVAAYAAISDVRRGLIPNWLTYGALLLGPLAHIVRSVAAHTTTNDALTEGGFAILGAVVCAIVPAILYRQGAVGGGDLKLLAACGAMLQSSQGVEAEMYTFFGATLFAPAFLAYRGQLISTLRNSALIFGNFFLPKEKRRTVDDKGLSWLRLGPAVLFGVMLTAYLHW